MLTAKYNWNLKPNEASSEQVDELTSSLGLNPIVAQLLINRGYSDPEAIKHFLSPDTSDLLDPFLLHDMEKAVTRIQTAIQNGEQITIYGDYDADGITSTSILYESLLEIGAQVNYYIPNRFDDGYGPNTEAFSKIIKDGTSLIVTVDNGVSGNEAIAAANKLGCDVIVTDHHELPKDLPNAYAIVHADLSPNYSFKYLSGAGVAFKLATALSDEIPQEKLDLVAIGTVADLVSLTGENRALVQFGLNVIHLTERPGLKELIKRAKLDLADVNEDDIGFKIAPELNAVGRMGDANPAVDMLTTTDETQAAKLAKITDKKNEQRKELVTQVTAEAEQQAKKQVNEGHKVLLLCGKTWHAGVLGIAASRIKDEYNRPTIILTQDDEGKLAKGSGRSVAGFDLFKALDGQRSLMTTFGGHEMAVGLTAPVANLDKLRLALDKAADENKLSSNQKAKLDIDYQVSADDVNMQLLDNLNVLSPFGTDNAKPRFAITPQTLADIKAIGQDNKHLKFALLGKHHKIAAIDFSEGSEAKNISELAENIKVAGTLNKNKFRGRTSLQIMVDDIKPYGVVIKDKRTNNLVKSMFNNDGVYIFFNPKLEKKLTGYLNDNSNAMLAKNISKQNDYKNTFIVDVPKDLKEFEELIDNLNAEEIVLYMFKNKHIKRIGMPNRLQYAKLFKFIKLHANLDIRKNLNIMEHNLKIDRNLLIFMTQVFEELNFITIDNGVINMLSNPDHHDLKSARSYKNREQEIQVEEQLLSISHNALLDLIQSIRK